MTLQLFLIFRGLQQTFILFAPKPGKKMFVVIIHALKETV